MEISFLIDSFKTYRFLRNCLIYVFAPQQVANAIAISRLGS